MDSPLTDDLRQTLLARFAELRSWLLRDAYPLWMTSGYDQVNGGFQERLNLDATPRDEPRRARVQPRQIYCYAMAPRLGFAQDVEPLVTAAIDNLFRRYQRDDGLFRTLVDRAGQPIDDRAVLYDQAFVLLACAAAQVFPSLRARCVQAGRDLRGQIERRLHTGTRGFNNGLPVSLPLQSNPHMHMLEACLAWIEVSDDVEWRRLAGEIGRLSLERFIDPSTGALREFFNDDWTPAHSIDGRIVEPGHQFEWAWLLMRWDPQNLLGGRTAARRLIDIAEHHGVRHGIAINALLDDLSVHDDVARLWPQTERLKANAFSAGIEPTRAHFEHASEAAAGLLTYFNTPVAGLWRDRRTPDGRFIDEPAPASSFYHIVAAVAALGGLAESL